MCFTQVCVHFFNRGTRLWMKNDAWRIAMRTYRENEEMEKDMHAALTFFECIKTLSVSATAKFPTQSHLNSPHVSSDTLRHGGYNINHTSKN